jgi:hypothetical protein
MGEMRTGIGKVAAVAALALLASPAAASAAKLAGAKQDGALRTAFQRDRHHTGASIVSIRVSTAKAGWAMIEWIPKGAPESVTSAAKPTVQRTTYHGTKPDSKPPKKVKKDLLEPLKVRLTFEGKGSESVDLKTTSQGECGGSVTDERTESISPIQWNISYVLDLDHFTLIRTSDPHYGGDLLQVLTHYEPSRSTVSVIEQRHHAATDDCDGATNTYDCTQTFGSPSQDSTGAVAIDRLGLVVQLETQLTATQGDCANTTFAAKPYYDDGGISAFTPALRILGGDLPADPYAPVTVTYPTNDFLEGYNGACALSGTTECHDDYSWTGQIQLHPM